jgi:tetratricopeptide (TPR) repeat protein
VADLEHAIDLSPVNAASALWKTVLSIGQAVLGKYDVALEMAQQACKDDPIYNPGYIAMALVLTLQGRKEEAQIAMEEAQRILPDLDRTKVETSWAPGRSNLSRKLALKFQIRNLNSGHIRPLPLDTCH